MIPYLAAPQVPGITDVPYLVPYTLTETFIQLGIGSSASDQIAGDYVVAVTTSPNEGLATAGLLGDLSSGGYISGPLVTGEHTYASAGPFSGTTLPWANSQVSLDGQWIGLWYPMGTGFGGSALAAFDQFIGVGFITLATHSILFLSPVVRELPASGGNWTVPAGATLEAAGLSFKPLPNDEPPSNLVYRNPRVLGFYSTQRDPVVVINVLDQYVDYPAAGSSSKVSYTVLFNVRTGAWRLLTDILAPFEIQGITGPPGDPSTGYCSTQEYLVGTGPFPSPQYSYLSGVTGHVRRYYTAHTIYDNSLSPVASFISVYSKWAHDLGDNFQRFVSSNDLPVVWQSFNRTTQETWYFQLSPLSNDWWFGPSSAPATFAGNVADHFSILSTNTNDYAFWVESLTNVYATEDGVEFMFVLPSINNNGIVGITVNPNTVAFITMRMAVGFDGSVRTGTKITMTPSLSSPAIPSGVTSWGVWFPQANFGRIPIIQLQGNGAADGRFMPFLLQIPDLPAPTVAGAAPVVPRSKAVPVSTTSRVGQRTVRANIGSSQITEASSGQIIGSS